MADLSKIFPIYSITNKGIIIGDNRGSLTACFELNLPIIFTLGYEEFSELIEKFRNFCELLGEEIIIHKQDHYHKELFSYASNELDKENFNDFIERSYSLHFNERNFLSCKSYLYITKLSNGNLKNIVSKDFAKTDDEIFVNNILASAEVLKDFISFRHIGKEELVSGESPISKYINLSSANMEEYKDIDFSNNSVFVGSTQVKIYSIEDLNQFPTDNIGYYNLYQGLPVSNLFSFSYPLDCPHIINQYMYIPNQTQLLQELEKKANNLKGFNVRGSNSAAYEEIDLFKHKINELGLQGIYYHFNIMCFDEAHDLINKKINLAFAESKFKKRESSLARKDLFLSGIPGNSTQIVNQKNNLMSLITDLEGCAFTNFEMNFSDDTTSPVGVKLCDRLYGIPRAVDLFDEPKRKGRIKNQNTIVLAGSGGGKSYFTNLIALYLHRQNAHIFAIDASFSYRLQAAMHNGVYLSFDDSNKISFNPFFVSWFLDPKSKEVFDENLNANDKIISKYINYLEDKINTLLGVINVMTKNEGEATERFEESINRKLLYNYFRKCCLNDEVQKMKFDNFFDYAVDELPKILEQKKLTKDDFNYSKFLSMLEVFRTGESLGYLLNSEDDKVKNLDTQRFVVIDVSKIRQNKILFSIISLLSMDLYNQKIAKLSFGIKKTLIIDEAWQSISSPEMATFMKGQVKVIRKYGGNTIFISQELDDFISSDIIKDSIINNSSIKIFADMGEFKQKFEPIKKALAISDNNEIKIKSLNQNNRKDSFYKEVCICWENVGQVYAVETPLELKAIFETDADEVAKILPQYEQYGIELTAINYANH
jgi:conjugation system TraG family ATPase